MAVTDLTNTSWVFKGDDEIDSLESTATFNINFISNSNSYTSISVDSSYIIIDYNSTTVYLGYDTTPWQNEAYRIIQITGGTDVTNPSLISWLQNNASQILVSDLANTTWVFNDNINSEWAGSDYWYINIEIDTHSQSPFDCMRWHFGSYLELGSFQSVVYYNGWVNTDYKTWTITGGTDATNLDLIAWFSINAVYLENDPPISQFQNCQICLKQPLGAYTLTWDSGITVTVSGNSVSQGYELQDGDIILATVDSSLGRVYAVINSITYNAPADISLDDTNIHISYYLQGSGGSVN